MNYKQFKYLGIILALSVSLTGCSISNYDVLKDPQVITEDNYEKGTELQDAVSVEDDILEDIHFDFGGVNKDYLIPNGYERAGDDDMAVYHKSDGGTAIRFNVPTKGKPTVVFKERGLITPDGQADMIRTYTETFFDMFNLKSDDELITGVVDTFLETILKPEVLEFRNGDYTNYISVDNIEFGVGVETSYMHMVAPELYEEGLVDYTISFKDVTHK